MQVCLDTRYCKNNTVIAVIVIAIIAEIKHNHDKQ